MESTQRYYAKNTGWSNWRVYDRTLPDNDNSIALVGDDGNMAARIAAALNMAEAVATILAVREVAQ